MLRIGSRGSALALWQARWVAAGLEELGEVCRIEVIRTSGDRLTDVALSRAGTKGLFIKELEEALLAGAIDLAVHSLKDMPAEPPGGLILAAVPEREDPRDAVAGRRLADLPGGARVGTGSPRRSAQLAALRPDLRVEPVRGNVDTRLRKLEESQFDALLLAAAGMRRLGFESRIAELLDPDVMCPAPGQGALALETRDSHEPAVSLARRLEHPPTRAAVDAERAVLRHLGGGCQVPIGAFAEVRNGSLALRAVVVSPDGRSLVRRRAEGPAIEAERLGARLAAELLDRGAREILDGVYRTA